MRDDEFWLLRQEVSTLSSNVTAIVFGLAFLPLFCLIAVVLNQFGLRLGYNTLTFDTVKNWTFFASVIGAPSVWWTTIKYTTKINQDLTRLEESLINKDVC